MYVMGRMDWSPGERHRRNYFSGKTTASPTWDFRNDPLPFLGQLQMIQKLTRQASKAYRIPFETILTYYETFGRWVPPVKCYVRIRFFNWGSKFGLWDGGQTDIMFLYCKVKSNFQSELASLIFCIKQVSNREMQMACYINLMPY